MRQVVSPGIFPPALLHLVFRIMPDEGKLTLLAPSGKSGVPLFYLIGGEDVFFLGVIFVLAQVVLQFQVEQGVFVLGCFGKQSSQASYAITEAVIVDMNKLP